MIVFMLGLATLILGADLLVRGASKLALSFGISPLVVGLTVVAFGTSAPELAVSVQSAWSGQVDIALGNVVGSNIFNILFVLGVSALITPLFVQRQIIHQEVPLMIAASLLLWAMAADGDISRWEGLALLTLLVVFTLFVIRQSRRESGRQEDGQIAEPPMRASRWEAHWAMHVALIVIGLGLLVQGSNWLVEAAVGFARALQVSELVIGLTIVAIGTSLPEVATSILAAVRGERDIAVGNAVGSNLFNILSVVGLSAMVSPAGLSVDAEMLAVDLPIMVVAAIICLPIFFTGQRLVRWEGGLFLACYLAYMAYLLMQASAHDWLQPFSNLMAQFVLPSIFVGLTVLAVRHWNIKRR